MKKKLTLILICIFTALCCAIGLAACNVNDGGNNGGDTSGDTSGDTGGNGGTVVGEPEHTHNYTESVVAPTCTESGYTLHTCSCGDSYIDNETVALGHDYIDHSAQAATCTQVGWEAYQSCSRCHYSTYQEIESLGHNYDTAV